VQRQPTANYGKGWTSVSGGVQGGLMTRIGMLIQVFASSGK
jgi:hypothetical protein